MNPNEKTDTERLADLYQLLMHGCKVPDSEYAKWCRDKIAMLDRKVAHIIALEKALALANSMILSGESHSELSTALIQKALKGGS